MVQSSPEISFVVCVRNVGYEASLELHKIYRVLPDPDAENDVDIRVVDEVAFAAQAPWLWWTSLTKVKFLGQQKENPREAIIRRFSYFVIHFVHNVRLRSSTGHGH